MKIFKILFFIVFVAAIGFSIFIAVRDGTYQVSDSRTIKAPAEAVFSEINDFKNWQDWAPLFKSSGAIRPFFAEKTKGVGGSFSWMGEEGNGTIETIASVQNTSISQIIHENGSPTEINWSIEPKETGVTVVFEIQGTKSFTEKALEFITNNMEIKHAWLYENGLTLLDTHLQEKLVKHSFKFKGMIAHGGGFYLYKSVSCSFEKAANKVKEKQQLISEFMVNKEIFSAGKPFKIINSTDKVTQKTDFEICIPVSEHVETSGAMALKHLKAGKVLKTVFRGDYKFIHKAWDATFEELANTNYQQDLNSKPFEVYLVGPNETGDPSKWITAIYIPVSNRFSPKDKTANIPLIDNDSFSNDL
jgi:effector-binding domain-containing protein/carbon monoxide dehydrogenase subunit G